MVDTLSDYTDGYAGSRRSEIKPATTDKPTVEEIQEARVRHKASFDRYWTDYKYPVRSDAPGGCDADIKIMHQFEDNAPRYIDFLLAELDQIEAKHESQLDDACEELGEIRGCKHCDLCEHHG